ncbi:P-loop containing nucleoside triphosphate hydrolase protein [Exophiala viscosa]|uniref:P-loop containing nucleoside triphosphate hydrolase protein n=1 Tax=Exophiala viscosa TaxID=2486360 RepID=A0AAN6DTN8_9EURO|nr:P-loop containing nucleoside triphosphate hydrolase protein [Exophiala viscosa]
MYLNALEWLNELRLICNHGLMHPGKEWQGVLQKASSAGPWNKTKAKQAFATLVDAGSAICKLCQANMATGTGEADSLEHSKPSLSRCMTVICSSCIQNRLNGEQVPGCGCNPACPKAEVSWAPETSNRPAEAGLPTIEEKKVSTKLRTLLQDLKQHEKAEKSVVFSFWTYTLDIIESLLRQHTSIPYARIDGNLSGARREQAIQRFQTDDSVRVILVSITCGGTGLDLTAASRAYLLEPQWNPMIEEQALSPIHRLGQTKEVNTIRYRVRNSFEEKVAMIQDMKRDIAAGAFSSDLPASGLSKSSRLQEFRDAF